MLKGPIMRFTKMHGLGNDYVFVDCFRERVDDPSALARRISDRHRGIGGDGLILICPADSADVGMRIFNADGSEAEMCGNGIRCLAKYVHDHGLSAANPLRVQTGAGVLSIDLELDGEGKVSAATVDMGEPILQARYIPVAPPGHDPAQPVIDYPCGFLLEEVSDAGGDVPAAAGVEESLTCVSMGNPHAVFFCRDVQAVPLERVGPILENHRMFPARTNVHFVQVNGPAELTMRTWERGSGITLACGTGASAVCVAGVLTGRSRRDVLIHLPGGDLKLQWRQADNHVLMTGPAVEVFAGEWPETA